MDPPSKHRACSRLWGVSLTLSALFFIGCLLTIAMAREGPSLPEVAQSRTLRFRALTRLESAVARQPSLKADTQGQILVSDGGPFGGSEYVGAADSAAVKFLVVGDWGRKGLYNQSLVAHQMGVVADRLKSQFVVSVGDNFYKTGLTGINDEAFTQSFTDVYSAASLQIPWYAVLGNHDYYGDALAQLDLTLTNRDSRWNCRRSGVISKPICPSSLPDSGQAVDFFLFDTVPMVAEYRTAKKMKKHPADWRGLNVSDWDAFNKQQIMELERALKRSKATWKIVVGHHPVYSYGHHGSTPELIKRLQPVLHAHKVDAYLSGHDHNMAHVKRDDSSVHYFTSGGGSKSWRPERPPAGATDSKYFWPGQGFASVQISVRHLEINFYGLGGEVLYSKLLVK